MSRRTAANRGTRGPGTVGRPPAERSSANRRGELALGKCLRPEADTSRALAHLDDLRMSVPLVVGPPSQVHEYLGWRQYDETLLVYDRSLAVERAADAPAA